MTLTVQYTIPCFASIAKRTSSQGAILYLFAFLPAIHKQIQYSKARFDDTIQYSPSLYPYVYFVPKFEHTSIQAYTNMV